MADYYEDAKMADNPQPEPREEASDSETATLPKSVLGGKEFKPGEEVVLEIVQVNEDSVVVRYATEEKEPSKEPEEEPEMAMGGGGNPGGGMSSMYE